jgi:hypothetical protein
MALGDYSCLTSSKVSAAAGTSGKNIISDCDAGRAIELFKPDGEGAGLEEILDRHDNLTIARAIYRGRATAD